LTSAVNRKVDADRTEVIKKESSDISKRNVTSQFEGLLVHDWECSEILTYFMEQSPS